jgi:hypothetical protein
VLPLELQDLFWCPGMEAFALRGPVSLDCPGEELSQRLQASVSTVRAFGVFVADLPELTALLHVV